MILGINAQTLKRNPVSQPMG